MPLIATVAILITSIGVFSHGASNAGKLIQEVQCEKSGGIFKVTKVATVNSFGQWQCQRPSPKLTK